MINEVIQIARKAATSILEVYGKADPAIEYKPDSSPLTEADKRSHDIIVKALGELAPEIPVISEESETASYEKRKDWDDLWLVDPLDGTKEFIKRNGEFTVNIGLIQDGEPALGVIVLPTSGDIYYGIKGEGSYLVTGGEKRSIRIRQEDSVPCAAVSRSHLSEKTEKLVKLLKAKTAKAGSALKFTLVADGKADIYPRLGPTWEWDTAAGHAIAVSSGAYVLDLNGNTLTYNKENLKHEGFIVTTPDLKDKVIKAIKEMSC